MNPPAARLAASIAAREPAAIALLEKWVRINSFTFHTEGVNRLGEATAEAFAPLGFHAGRVPSERPSAGNHLVLTKTGTAKPALVFVTHLDTVHPPEEEARTGFGWREDGDRIYGPGTIDIKGGTALLWLMLRALRDVDREAFDRTPVTIFCNATEEGYHTHFGEVVDARWPAGAAACLVMEPELISDDSDARQVVTCRKGGARFSIEVAGHGGHAGTSHAAGANAIRHLARLIEAAEEVTDDAREITVNIGTVRGGEFPNRIPHQARAEGDVRAFSRTNLDRAITALRGLESLPPLLSRDGKRACSARVEIRDILPNMETTPGSSALAALWKSCGRELGIDVHETRRGGLGDANLLCHRAPTLDGLGAVGANLHVSEHDPDKGKFAEFLLRPAFAKKALLNCLAIRRLLANTATDETIPQSGKFWTG